MMFKADLPMADLLCLCGVGPTGKAGGVAACGIPMRSTNREYHKGIPIANTNREYLKGIPTYSILS